MVIHEATLRNLETQLGNVRSRDDVSSVANLTVDAHQNVDVYFRVTQEDRYRNLRCLHKRTGPKREGTSRAIPGSIHGKITATQACIEITLNGKSQAEAQRLHEGMRRRVFTVGNT